MSDITECVRRAAAAGEPPARQRPARPGAARRCDSVADARPPAPHGSDAGCAPLSFCSLVPDPPNEYPVGDLTAMPIRTNVLATKCSGPVRKDIVDREDCMSGCLHRSRVVKAVRATAASAATPAARASRASAAVATGNDDCTASGAGVRGTDSAVETGQVCSICKHASSTEQPSAYHPCFFLSAPKCATSGFAASHSFVFVSAQYTRRQDSCSDCNGLKVQLSCP